MGIILARIDNRLIHGQVLEAWIPYLRADCIVVANDQVAGATFQRLLMETAVPKGIRVVIGTLAEVNRLFASGELDDQRILLLFGNSTDALEACRLGIDFSRLNLGNMHGGEGRKRLTCTISLGADDIENLESLEKRGVSVFSQCLPTDRELSWRKLIRNAGG
jgi:mannose/fructose/N-acetylgalactosamine-specific phosphotransferase system component IIB